MRIHGHSTRLGKSPTYISWDAMMQRCTNPRHKQYHDYGGRGIRVCKRWLKFENFLEDMGERPPDTTIDRLNGSRGYTPTNCRWATRQQQTVTMRTRKDAVYYRGKHISYWVQIYGVPRGTLTSQLRRKGSLSTPRNRRAP